ncbi:MAG: hypothetical protein QNJ44_08435 [Rhodobacter sp.]|nr:hypothetical protein [Rhodobacter sp.]
MTDGDARVNAKAFQAAVVAAAGICRKGAPIKGAGFGVGQRRRATNVRIHRVSFGPTPALLPVRWIAE